MPTHPSNVRLNARTRRHLHELLGPDRCIDTLPDYEAIERYMARARRERSLAIGRTIVAAIDATTEAIRIASYRIFVGPQEKAMSMKPLMQIAAPGLAALLAFAVAKGTMDGNHRGAMIDAGTPYSADHARVQYAESDNELPPSF